MNRTVQARKALLAATLAVVGIFCYVGLAASGRGSQTLAVVHAGSNPAQTGGTGQAPHSGTQPKRHHVSLSWHAGPPTGAGTEDLVNGYDVWRHDATTANYAKVTVRTPYP